MKTKLWLIAAFLMIAASVQGADDWQSRAELKVDSPGIVEAILSPELSVRAMPGSVDLALAGPDGRPRSFELYWREPIGRTEVELKPVDISLGVESGFIWEGKTDQVLQADAIRIEIADQGFVAKVDVEGLGPQGWVPLKKDAALFNADHQVQKEFELEKNQYAGIRLTFRSFDKKFEKKFTPIRKVFLKGEKTGKDYWVKTIRPEFQQVEQEGVTEVKAILPGSGLWVNSIDFVTQAQFQGTLKAGIEKIEGGEQKFVPLLTTVIDRVSGKKQAVSVDLKSLWPCRNLVLKLDSPNAFIGQVRDLSVAVMCPRLVFSADAAGAYSAVSGAGKSEMIKEFPGDPKRVVDHEAVFSAFAENIDRKPESLAEKYRITGGPFNDQGYTWQSRITISEPDYFRLVLNMAPSLEKNVNSIRLVKENTQVPFVFGKSRDRELDLTKSTVFEYDSQHNVSTITIALPQASSHWAKLTLYAKGIFQRTLQIETPKPGSMGWQKCLTRTWESHAPEKTQFSVNLDSFGDLDRLRISINHGDNEAIKINRITATYAAPTLNFIAREKGEYLIYGGNPKATPAVYDLSLVQASLLEELPKIIEMGETTAFRSVSWKRTAERIFSDKGWGLYAILGLVAMVLLIVIVKLFPKEKSE